MSPSPRRTTVVIVTTTPQMLAQLFPRVVKRLIADGFGPVGATSAGTWLTAADAASAAGLPVRTVALRRAIRPTTDLVALIQLTLLFLRLRPVAVSAHTQKAGLLAMLAAWLRRVPVRVYTIRGVPHVVHTGMTRRLVLWSERLAIRSATSVVAVSASVRDELRAVGVDVSGVVVLGNGSGQGVDLVRFDPDCEPLKDWRSELRLSPDDLLLAYFGRTKNAKGIRELERVWSIVRQDPRLHLAIAGPAEGWDGSGADGTWARTDARVHLLGRVETMPDLWAATDVYLAPSHAEGFSNSVLEAAAMRVPVVCFDVVGNRDAVIDRVTGRVVPFPDVDAFAAATAGLVGNPEERTRLGHEARQRAERCFEADYVVGLHVDHLVTQIAQARNAGL